MNTISGGERPLKTTSSDEETRSRVLKVMRLVAESAITKRNNPGIPDEHLVDEILRASEENEH